jgi:hypothetical protein
MKPIQEITKNLPKPIEEITKNLPKPNKKKEPFNIKEYIQKLKDKFKCKCVVSFD